MKPLELIASHKRKGYVLIAFTLTLMLLLGTAGLTFDVGRMYITKNEAQSYCDAAALYAVWKLNGKRDGITAARAAALATPKQWDFGTRPFDPSRTTVEFAKTYAGPWDPDPNPAADYLYARVSTSVLLPMALMPALTGVFRSTIAARATAKQLPITSVPNNIFPFAPFLIVPDGGVLPTNGGIPSIAPTNPVDPYNMIPAITGAAAPYDLQQGGIYTLRGPSSLRYNPSPTNLANDMCANDRTSAQERYRYNSGIPDRGFIWDTKSMSDIRNAIQGNAVPQDGHTINIGDSVDENCYFCMVEGTRQTAAHAIQDRVLSDGNPLAENYHQYVDEGSLGGDNSRRVVVVPMVTGVCATGSGCPVNPLTGLAYPDNTVIGFASFFLLREGAYQDNATAPLCAEYVGPWVPNSSGGGASSTGGGTGGSVPTLVD